MISIGVITGNLKQNQTGMATYAFNVLEGIKNKYQVTQIADESGEILNGCIRKIPKTFYLPFNYLAWSITTSFQKQIFSQFDLVHNMGQYPIIPPCNKKSIITIYDLIPILYPELVTPIYAWQSKNFLPRLLKKSDRILAISEHTKNDIINRYQIPSEKIDVTYLGVSNHFRPCDPEKIQHYKEKNELINPYILYVGALEPKKNIPVIIKAFALCLKKNSDLILVLAGKPSWKFQEIFLLIQSMNLEKKIKFLDFVPYNELPLLYGGSEVFVFPSRYEGFGLPPLEAMKCGTPVIVSNSSSLPEIVGKGGLMINSDDFYGLYDLIMKIIEEPDFRNKMKNYYLNQAHQFSWERCINETIMSYERTLSV